MKDYYNLFVELSLQQCTKNDYGNKLKVKKHNAAYKKLNKLQDEMMKNIGDDALHALLNHEDDRVKVNAASFCLKSEVLVEQSILTLEKIIAGSDDPTICFSAKMLLQNSDELYQQASPFGDKGQSQALKGFWGTPDKFCLCGITTATLSVPFITAKNITT